MNRLTKTILYVMLFATLATIFGTYSPTVYRKYFDKTIYYQVKLPIKVDSTKEIHPCEYIDAYLERKALIDIEGEVNLDLVLVRADQKKDIIGEVKRTLTAQRGENTVIAHWQVACDAKPGFYYFLGFASYRVNDVLKQTPLKTEEFEVVLKPEPTPTP